MPPEHVGLQHSRRCNTVFWTAYIIDREFGTLIGAPSSIRDEDITTKLPSEADGSAKAAALTLQIKLARLTAMILTGVYGVDRNFDGTLLRDTQSVLHSIAAVSRDLTAYLDTRLGGTDIRTSKIATRLILSYHHVNCRCSSLPRPSKAYLPQCVVLTTRPLVMCVLQRRLAGNESADSIPDGPISSLLESSSYSALNILKTLKALGDSNLLGMFSNVTKFTENINELTPADAFLPFQMETAFSSAFLLHTLNAVLPGFVQDTSWLETVHGIFDMMIAKGSPAAQLRKREFQRLEDVMTSYLQRGQDEVVPDLPEEVASLSETAAESLRGLFQNTDAETVDECSPWGLLGSHGGFAMSPTEILTLADSLLMEDFIVHE